MTGQVLNLSQAPPSADGRKVGDVSTQLQGPPSLCFPSAHPLATVTSLSLHTSLSFLLTFLLSLIPPSSLLSSPHSFLTPLHSDTLLPQALAPSSNLDSHHPSLAPTCPF